MVAVSGGSDSTALLLAAAKAKLKGLAIDPIAVTVDHGLRAASALEAGAVAAFAARIGIAHITKSWIGAKPASGIQAQARKMRRALLAEAAGEVGACCILTGHTQDDQAETVAMRQKRGPGPGLAGIAPASLVYNDLADGEPMWIVRPFLELRRDALRHFLTANRVDWIDDPSNENTVFERVGIRQELADAGAERFMALQFIQADAAGRRVAVAREAARLAGFYASEPHPGLVRVDPGIFQASNLEAIRLALRVLIAFAGGSESAAGEDLAHYIIDCALRAGFGAGRKPSRRTASGALIDVRKDGVWMMRERRKSSTGSMPFDGRYRQLGRARETGETPSTLYRGTIAASLVQQANMSEPLYAHENEEAVPAWQAALSGAPLRRLINPWPDLVPGFDARLAERLSILAGEGDFPPCPVHRDGKI